MCHCLRLVVLLGIICSSLLTFTSPAEAFGRCRHRQQCRPICAPCPCSQPVCVGQAYEERPRAMACLYCNGSTYQEATNGETCSWMDAGMINSACTNVPPPPPEGVHGKYTLRHGCDYWFDWTTGLSHWYSSSDGSSYCDASTPWESGRVTRVKLVGFCPNGRLCWDIYTSD